jgi:hypothetical protein
VSLFKVLYFEENPVDTVPNRKEGRCRCLEYHPVQ